MATTMTRMSAAVDAALSACALPLHEAPSVSAAASRMAETAQVADAAARRLARYLQILDPHRRGEGSPSFDEMQVLEAHEHIAAARVDDAKARREAAMARATYDARVAEERARRRSLIRQAKRDVARRLEVRLEALRHGENAEAALLDDADRMTCGGSIIVPLAWPEFMVSTSLATSLLDTRVVALREDGLLD